LAHFAGPKMPEPFPGEPTVLLAPGAIQGDDVEVWIESQVGRCPLHGGDRTALRAAPTLPVPAGTPAPLAPNPPPPPRGGAEAPNPVPPAMPGKRPNRSPVCARRCRH